MSFYNEPSFWTCLGLTISSLFGLVKFYFVHKDRTNSKEASRCEKIENLKADNMQKSIDFLNSAIARIEPMVLNHEASNKDLTKSTQMVGIIEKNLTAMFADLRLQYEGFERRIINVTVSYQRLMDRVDEIEKKFGSVKLKP